MATAARRMRGTRPKRRLALIIKYLGRGERCSTGAALLADESGAPSGISWATSQTSATPGTPRPYTCPRRSPKKSRRSWLCTRAEDAAFLVRAAAARPPGERCKLHRKTSGARGLRRNPFALPARATMHKSCLGQAMRCSSAGALMQAGSLVRPSINPATRTADSSWLQQFPDGSPAQRSMTSACGPTPAAATGNSARLDGQTAAHREPRLLGTMNRRRRSFRTGVYL